MISCRSCENKELKKVINLGDYYLSDFFVNKRGLKRFPLDLLFCGKCKLLQLTKTTPAKYLYSDRYGYRSGMNQSMKNALEKIVEILTKKILLKKGDVVIDIGCNDKTLLSFYPKDVTRIGFDPVSKFKSNFDGKNEFFVNDYFSSSAFFKISAQKAKIVTAISMFYDLDDPNIFLEDVKKVLDDDGILVIQQNYLPTMVKNNAVDNIVHEHITYFSLLSLENLLKRHGLTVFDVNVDETNGGSFRTLIGFEGRKRINKSVMDLRKKEETENVNNHRIYKNFLTDAKKIAKDLNAFIKQEVGKGKLVYLYGASTRGNTLIQFANLNNKLIKKAVDRNPEKWGKKIASLNIPIISEDEARLSPPDYMLVLPWFFEKEFLKRESKFLKNGGHFIFPLPKLKIV